MTESFSSRYPVTASHPASDDDLVPSRSSSEEYRSSRRELAGDGGGEDEDGEVNDDGDDEIDDADDADDDDGVFEDEDDDDDDDDDDDAPTEEAVWEHGTEVFVNNGTVYDGIGSGAAYVFQFEGAFWAAPQDADLEGPFNTITEAIEASYAHWVIGDEVWITSTLMTSEQIVPLLHVEYPPSDEPFVFTINDEPWEVGTDGVIRRSAAQPDHEEDR
jgi:hypothetical protein